MFKVESGWMGEGGRYMILRASLVFDETVWKQQYGLIIGHNLDDPNECITVGLYFATLR